MRILHAPVNIAGQPYAMVKALRRKGVQAELLVFKERPFVRGYDRSLHLERYRSRLVKWLIAFRALISSAYSYDLFHFHTSVSLLYPFHWDLPLLKALGKKVVVQFWGSDIRGKDSNSLSYLCHADAVVVGSYHMLDFVPRGSHVVLPGLDLSSWPLADLARDNEKLRIVHAPSSRRIKGTERVLSTVEALQKRGLPIELVLIEGIPNQQALEIYQTCDIAIDQFGGWYGIFALEMMAFGIPVIGRIDEIHAERLADALGVRPPILSVSEDNLSETLERLATNPLSIRERGQAARQYVESVHNIERSAVELLRIYQQL